MATRVLLAELSAASAAIGLPLVEIESVGGVDAARRVALGERVDLVILASDALQDLAQHGHVVPSSVTPLASSHTAIAIRSRGSFDATPPSTPAFDDAVGVRAALRDAGSVGYSTGPSGAALLRQIENWNMAAEMRDRLVQARSGTPVARLVADGEVDIGFQQLSEMIGQDGIRILGVLPPDCAIETVFAGGVATATADPAAALSVLSFFCSAAAAPIKRMHGFNDASAS